MKRIRNTVLFIFLVYCGSTAVHAQSLAILGRRTGLHTVDYSMKLGIPDNSFLTGVLEDNRKLRLVYELRLYKKSKGFTALLGDSLLTSSSHEFVLSKDAVSGQFIADENGVINYFVDEEELITYITTIFGTFFLEEETRINSPVYLKGRCTIRPDIMEPPLKIVEIFLREKIIRLEWVTFSLDNRP